MTKRPLMSAGFCLRWGVILGVAAGAGAYGVLRPSSVLVSHAIDLAQIVGVFAGLGLTAISIMAALPLEGWVRRARQTDHLVALSLVKHLRELPDQFRKYLTGQLVAIALLLVIGLMSDEFDQHLKLGKDIPVDDLWKWLAGAASAITAGTTAFCCFAAWDTFALLHQITIRSVERYRDEGIDSTAPSSSLTEDDLAEPGSVSGKVEKSATSRSLGRDKKG